MKNQKIPNNNRTSKVNRIVLYTAIVMVGAVSGFGASPAPTESKDAKKETIEKVAKAFKQIAEDATGNTKEEKKILESPTDTESKKNNETDQNAEQSKNKDVIISNEVASEIDKKVEPHKSFAPSAEPDDISDGKLPAYRILPQPDRSGGAGKKVLIIEVHDVIDMGISAHIERSINTHKDAAAVILDINTPGGRVDAATKIRDALINAPKTMRTVAFVHPRAISAGAFIAFACDLIIFAEGGTMGAATPISIGGGGEAVPVEEKMVSYFRTEMAATARAKGRRGDIAEAMVDAEIEIKDVTPAGKLLTLDTAGALRLGIADAKADSLEQVMEILALGAADVDKTTMNWAEKVARILTDPMLSSILMSIGMLGILIELYQPGFGLPGIVGIASLLIFFAGHLVVNLAGWEEAILFLIGIVLLIVEIFVIPGFGVIGIAGILAIVTSLVLSMNSLPLDVSFSTGNLTSSVLRVTVSMIASIVLLFVAMALLPKTAVKSRLVLDTVIDARADGGREGEIIKSILSSGMLGQADSFLRPSGIAKFGDNRVDVTSEGDFIEKGETVVIVRVQGNHVVVKKA